MWLSVHHSPELRAMVSTAYLRDLISSPISMRVLLILLRTLTISSLYMADHEKIVKSI